jgi:hypothetical protein
VLYHSQPFLSALQTREMHMDSPRRCGFSRRYGFTVCTTFKQDDYTREGRATGSN